MALKQLIRVIGIDDGQFVPRKKGFTLLVGVVYRLDGRVEGVISEKIEVDALNASQKICEMIKNSRFEKQVKCVLLHGINFAGFNIADISLISKELSVPVIVCFKKKPNILKIRNALKNFPDFKKRIELIEKAPKIKPFNSIFFQCMGCTEIEAKKIINKTLLNSSMPEPLRLAHLIASGVTKNLSDLK
jgi:hypothetical protein